MTQTHENTQGLQALSQQMADAVERAQSSLVLVDGRSRQPASGIIYAPDLILTASHVLERSEKVQIHTADKQTHAAQIVGRDRTSDLAVLRVPGLVQTPATPAPEAARVGQLVLAIGASTDGPMASIGIVSSAGGPLRTEQGVALERFIRTDAIPYPGFSGGPLIDTQGQVLGLLTTGIVNGIPFVIPIDLATSLAETLATQGTVKRGYLGIASQLVQLPEQQRGESQRKHGLLLVKVDDPSPAHTGGLFLGDILVALDGHAVTDSEDLQLLLTGERVGKAVPVEIIRGGTVHTLQVTIGQRPA